MELTKMILNRREAASVPDRYLGGKAAQLAWLFRHGFPGPDFWVLTTQAWEAQLAYAGLTQWLPAQLAHLTADADAGAAVRISCAGIQERLLSAALCPKIEKQLCQTLNADSLTGAYVAVRSSVVGEDSLKASFAGQMDSFLFRKGVPQIVDALRRCWASAFSERAVRYRLQKGLPLHPVNMGVIMQLMIEGEVSGVVFTANPATGCRHQALLTSTYGLGEGLVSGECNADEYTIDYRSDAIIAKRISAKDYQREFDRTNGFGTRLVTIAGSAAQRPCLPDSWILEITRKARHIAGLAGCPQDIEWTLRGDTIYFLQTRPITILPSAAGASDRKTVWDNSNIQESYCGVTTPLTFSFASHAYATVYEQTMRLMGISEKVIAAHQDMLQNLLGLIRGRVYYNINQWYRGLLLLPSFQRNKADLERMMGLQDPVDFVEDQAYSFTGKLGKLPALLRTYARLLAAFRQLPARVTEFHRMFEAEYRQISRPQLPEYSAGELISLAESLEERLLKRWQTPIINDFYVMMYNGKVRRWLEKAGLPQAASLQNKLLSGEEGMLSTEPTKELLNLAGEVRKDPVLRALFAQYGNAQLLAAVQISAPAFYDRCIQYIERYGDRCIGELKLESVTLRQDASFMFQIVRNYLAEENLDTERLRREEKKHRLDAETEAFAAIGATLGRWALRRFKGDLCRFREGVKNRENMRLARTRMFGLFRDIYAQIGQQLAFAEVLEQTEDVFYLTVPELKHYRDGRSVNAALKPIVASRRAEFAAYAREELPHHFITTGPPYYQNTFRYPYSPDDARAETGPDEFRGTGCYPGTVEGQVKLIFSPADELSLNGSILCTVRTDPGWTPLFPSCRGIIVERGSTLSHSAVVARELGIPAIVGVKDITRYLHSGDFVRMDGNTGIIQRRSP